MTKFTALILIAIVAPEAIGHFSFDDHNGHKYKFKHNNQMQIGSMVTVLIIQMILATVTNIVNNGVHLIEFLNK